MPALGAARRLLPVAEVVKWRAIAKNAPRRLLLASLNTVIVVGWFTH